MDPRIKSSEAAVARRRIEHLRFARLTEQRISEVIGVSREFVRQHLAQVNLRGR